MWYSAKQNTWFDPKCRSIYEVNGTWPDDAKEYSVEVYHSVVTNRPANKIMIPGDSGHPTLSYPMKPARTKESLLAELADKRWQVETGGIVVAGIRAATDRESQAQLNNVYVSLKAGLIINTPWKDADGYFKVMTLSDIEPIAHAVASHVSACFSAEQSQSDSIGALLNQADIDAYDINSGWPYFGV
ncbi:TPA: DUF4376 domain-containing protein [Aeromonas hydrophila]